MNQSNKEIIKATREFRDAMTADTAIIEIAKMLSRSADRLDVTTAALREKTKQYVASVTAERVWEATMMEVCGEDGPASVAIKFKELLIGRDALARENAALKHAMSVTLEHVSVMDTGQAGVAAMIINDALHNSETPAADAALAEIEARGVEKFAASLKVVGGHEHPYSAVANEFAAELRKGAAV